MNMITRNIPDELHRSVKVSAAVEGRSLQETIISLMALKAIIRDPRAAAMENVEFRLIPHRSDDSKDDQSVWSWKLQAWADGKLEETTIL